MSTVTCDSGEGSGRWADPGWFSGAHSQVINCAARHRELKVSPGEPVRRDLHPSLWVVLDSTGDLRLILDIGAVDAVPGRPCPVMLADLLHPDIQSSGRTRIWGGKRRLLTERAQIHCLALVLQVLWTSVLSVKLEMTGKKQTIGWDWLFLIIKKTVILMVCAKILFQFNTYNYFRQINRTKITP